MIESGLVFSETLYDRLYPVITIARICVWLFAFISAYGLSIQYRNISKQHGNRSNISFVLSHWLKLMWKWWLTMIALMIIYKIFVGNVAELYDSNVLLFFLDLFEWNDFFGYPRVLGNWYLCFAQILIVSIPFFNIVCNKFGILIIPVAYIGMQYMGDGIISTGGGAYSRYFLTILAGVCLAQDNLGLLAHRRYKLVRYMEMLLLLLISCALLIIQYKLINDEKQVSMVLRMTAVVCIVTFIVKYVNGTLSIILEFFGKHSTEMFIGNVFIITYLKRIVFWSDNPIIAYISLVIAAVIFSCCIQFAAAKTPYNKLLNNMLTFIQERTGETSYD